MTNIIKCKLPSMDLRGRIKPQKEQATVEHIFADSTDMSKLAKKLLCGLEAFIHEIKDKDIGKVYVTLPDIGNIINAVQETGWIKEVDYPASFRAHDGESYINGVDMVYFLDERRKTSQTEQSAIETLIDKVLSYQRRQTSQPSLVQGYEFRRGKPQDSKQIAEILGACFLCNDDWPDGFKEEFVKKTFSNRNQLWAVCQNYKGRLVGIASAYLNDGPQILGYIPRNCEIADCAILPKERGKGLIKELIRMVGEWVTAHDQIPYAYCTTEAEGFHRIMVSLGYKLTGVSQQTNHLLLRKGPEQTLPDEIPYTNNLVFFKV